MQTSYRKLWLALPAIGVSVGDFAVTLMGQPAGYWADAARHNEANPLSAWALSHGPGVYLLSKVVYLGLVTAAIGLLPRVFSLAAAMALVVAHGFGILTWLLYDSGLGFPWVIVFFPALTAVLVWQAWFYFRRLEPSAAPAGAERPQPGA